MDHMDNGNKSELKKKLSPMAYAVTQEQETEPAFTGKYVDHKKDGDYNCIVCGTKLFSSDTKFDSGTGWPSFDSPSTLETVELRPDNSHGMNRTEVSCKTCGAHLGHLFDDTSASSPQQNSGQAAQEVLRQDGKPATKRYCINSCALDFKGQN